MGDKVDLAATGPKRLPLGERLVDTNFLELSLQPVSLGLLALFLMTIVFGKFLYGVRFLVSDVLHAKANKKKRNAARTERRKSRVEQRSAKRGETSAPAGGAAAPAPAAAAAAGPDDVSVALSQTERRASQFTGVQLVAANMEASRNAAFVSLDSQLVEADNPAVAISFTGYLVSLCIMITGPRTPYQPGDAPEQEFFDAVVWTTIGVILLYVANWINSRVLLVSVLAQASLLDGNVCTALTEAGSFIASSLIIRATLSGESSDVTFWDSLLTTLIYFALGQLCLLIGSALLQWLTPYDDQKEARDANPAAGVKFAGNLLALGFLISSPLTKSDSIVAFGCSFALGLLLLTVLRIFVDRVVFPGDRKVDDEIEQDKNWGIALVEAVATTVLSIALGALMRDTPCVSLAS